ncbi:PLP-dependent aminotransferase family protein [Bartonella sp. HY329]|uniref:aminotransferase-like domain-containing protein n=1 Tax=unclassified Bartonella TaxID=2645622 RepID=UPI0021CA08C2|nr:MULTISPECIES: PLP-dependent aminotransferase family protein [unclassified Bartonella]UXM94650.1 PLP-dependent aminotransferase family protein [Bartonella sp. HY329]UXN08973.1 PLP-dependent aminotransferase family protein [Bartonella sp. HY328]
MSRVDEIVAVTAKRIREGVLLTGERLSSVRKAALQFGVSKNTMAEAYDRLVAMGLLHARKGSGYYVLAIDVKKNNEISPQVHNAIDIASLLLEQLDHHYDVRPGDGRPPAAWMENSELKSQFSQFRMMSRDWVDFGYGTPWGYAPLRETLRQRLSERSIAVASDGVLLTNGANHAMDLVIRYALSPGDTVFVDDPGYYPLFAKLTLANINVVGIDRLEDGPDIDDLRNKLMLHQPKAFFTQSQLQNPTGGELSPAKAFSLLKIAEEYGFLLVENDVFGDLLPPSLTRLAASAEIGRVLYIGSFSKTLSANLRLGYVAGDAAIIRELCKLKMLTTIASSDYVERFVDRLIRGGHYDRHLKRLNQRVIDAFADARAIFTKIGIELRPTRHCGFYLWAKLPADCDELALSVRAADQSIFIAPGRFFRVDQKIKKSAMRVNIAYANDPRFIAFLQKEFTPLISPSISSD